MAQSREGGRKGRLPLFGKESRKRSVSRVTTRATGRTLAWKPQSRRPSCGRPTGRPAPTGHGAAGSGAGARAGGGPLPSPVPDVRADAAEPCLMSRSRSKCWFHTRYTRRPSWRISVRSSTRHHCSATLPFSTRKIEISSISIRRPVGSRPKNEPSCVPVET